MVPVGIWLDRPQLASACLTYAVLVTRVVKTHLYSSADRGTSGKPCEQGDGPLMTWTFMGNKEGWQIIAADRCRCSGFSRKQPLLDPGFGVICKVRIPEPWCFGNCTLRPPLCSNTNLPPTSPRPSSHDRLFHRLGDFLLLYNSTVLQFLSIGPEAFVHTGRPQHDRVDHHLNQEASKGREIRKAHFRLAHLLKRPRLYLLSPAEAGTS